MDHFIALSGIPHCPRAVAADFVPRQQIANAPANQVVDRIEQQLAQLNRAGYCRSPDALSDSRTKPPGGEA
jgi:hypothetical protein